MILVFGQSDEVYRNEKHLYKKSVVVLLNNCVEHVLQAKYVGIKKLERRKT